MSDFEQFPYHVLIGTALSQFVHALLGGHPDISISTAAYLRGGWVEDAIDTLMGDGHCEESWHADCRFADAVFAFSAKAKR